MARLQPLLDPLVDTVYVQTIKDAFKDRIDLIICTLAFEESRMIEFLQAVKRTASAASIPLSVVALCPACCRTAWFRVCGERACKPALKHSWT